VRPTVQMIEPEIYVTYRLILGNNISPQRAIKLWADTKSTYYENNTGRGKLKIILAEYIKDFWAESNTREMSDDTEVIRFIEKFQPKPWWKFW
jgi:hypothetical protein